MYIEEGEIRAIGDIDLRINISELYSYHANPRLELDKELYTFG